MDVKFRRRPRTSSEKVDGFVFQFGKHIITFVMFAVFLGGMLIGTIFLKTDNGVKEKISEMFSSFITLSGEQTFLKNCINQFAVNVAFLLVSFVFGLCAVGTPISFLLPFVKGISIGAVSSYMYSAYALKGFGYCTLVFFPPQIISCLIVIVSAKECFNMSKDLFILLSDSRQGRSNMTDIKLYMIRFEIFLAVLIVSSLLGGLLNTYLTGIFKF